jgi:SAM-dependent methyltransferase
MRRAFVRPLLGDEERQRQLVYARCENCNHMALVEGAERTSIYAAADYFTARRATGAGYDGYESERPYREAKGRRIIQWVARGQPRGGRFLEVGSGYGYTRRAAAEAGWLTCGVDLNRHAADRSRALYGTHTHVGTLQECLDERRVEAASWDVVLYQFVLEHVADPIRELRVAASALAPFGMLALVVPSADAAEVDVFGGHYRSFRGDHLHVFSRRSLEMALRAVGLEVVSQRTSCGIHLLRGFLSDDTLADIYARGRGPDLYLLAQRIEP